MKRPFVCSLMILCSVLLLSVYASEQRQIPITVKAEPASIPLKAGGPLLLRVTISNGLSHDIRFQTFSLSPNDWNGETINISLVDIYGDTPPPTSLPMGLFYARPKLGEVPKSIAGQSSYAIKPHESLSVLIDISKWQIREGWKPGKYKMTVRADNIYVDQYTTASVMSDMVEIEITDSAGPSSNFLQLAREVEFLGFQYFLYLGLSRFRSRSRLALESRAAADPGLHYCGA